jgi:uncharacterized protein DUF736
MIIGHFSYDLDHDTYAGEITTLTLQRSNVVFRPTAKSGDREPDYRVVQERDGALVRRGSAAATEEAHSSPSCWTIRPYRHLLTRHCFIPTLTNEPRSSGSGRPGKHQPQKPNPRMPGLGNLPLPASRGSAKAAFTSTKVRLRRVRSHQRPWSGHRRLIVQCKLKPRAWKPVTGPCHNHLPVHPWSGIMVLRAADQTACRLSAEDLPVLRSATISKAIFCPSLRASMPARSTALMCTKTSLPPSSGWMKPKPLWSLNHFTIPCVI